MLEVVIRVRVHLAFYSLKRVQDDYRQLDEVHPKISKDVLLWEWKLQVMCRSYHEQR